MNTKLLFIGLVVGIVLISGCTEEQQKQVGIVCNKPYIQVGTDCCLDADQNSICDKDEETTTPEETTTIKQPSIETTLPATTIQSPPTTVVPTTIVSTTTLKTTYGCTKTAGYDPDSFIYAYSDGCGENFLSHANAASNGKGVALTKVDIGILDPKEIELLECFYGGYYDGNMEFSYCPRLLCPKTGQVENVDGRKPASVQMNSFAKNCA